MIPILDNGHAGMIGGIYGTAGKRSPDWPAGILYEGMFNRWVVNRLIEKMDREGIPYFHVSPEHTDIALSTRVKRTNAIHDNYPNTYLLSIHANGGGGEGLEGFTSRGETKSDAIAETFLCNFDEDLGGKYKMRFDTTDGDRDKEAGYKILVETNSPAILLELGFMDNKKDYKRLWSQQYIDELVNSMLKSIKQLKSF